MTASDGFDRTVSEWLHADAAYRVPDHLDAVLRRTSTARQRPAWSSLERWLPVQMTLRLSPVPRAAWLLVALALITIVAATVLVVGSRPHLPAPFGLARDGALVSSHDGDIYAVDPATGTERAIVADPRFDFGLTFSRDGTRFMFLRVASGGCEPNCGLILAVADADGSDVLELSPPVDGLDWQDWSPDSRQIAFLSRVDGDGLINVVNVDGTGLRTLDVGRPAHEISWLPPDGREIIFRGEQLHDTDPPSGIFAVRPDGTGLRELSTRPALAVYDYQGVAVSPDGALVAYTGAERTGAERAGSQIHLLDLRTGDDRLLPAASGAAGQSGAVFSPDGSKVVYLRWYADNTAQLVVAPADGTGTGIALEPGRGVGSDGPYINNYAFTPDGQAVIANDDLDKVARLMPIDGSEASILSTGELAFAAYQRVAP